VQEWSDRKASGVSSMDISSNEELLAIAFKNNQIATLDLSKAMQNITNLKLTKRERKDTQLEYLYKGFHNGPITAIDVCI